MVMALFLSAARFVLKSVQPDGLLQEKASHCPVILFDYERKTA
jgi:hypothetical protein